MTAADGTTREVEVSLTVAADLSGVTAAKGVTTTPGKALDAADAVAGLPEGATATWKVEPDWSKPGTQTGTVTITAADGTTRDVEVTLTVAEAGPEATGSALSAPTALARTGASVGGALVAAALLTGAGTLIIRRRKA